MALNVEFIRDEWIPALRSGEFEQGIGYLNYDNKYCCLGVACEILSRKGMVNKQRTPYYENKLVTYDGEGTSLPEKIAEFIGIDIDGRMEDAAGLNVLNDRYLENFTKIADILEQAINPNLQTKLKEYKSA